jgi:dihydrolipoamide dehydrogenase
MIIVLGGGPAGRIAAVHLAEEGADVMMIEAGAIGGQCLNFGCMLVCGLNDAARFMAASGRFHRLGLFDSVPSLSFPKLMEELVSVQKTIAGVLDAETKESGVEIIYGKDAGLDGGSVTVGDETLCPDAVIAATGSHPLIPDIPGTGLPGVLTPHTIPAMKSLPASLAIIGGGIMAAEFAYIFSAFGTRVHLLSRSGFLKNIDPHLRELAIRELAGVTVTENCRVTGIAGENRARSILYTAGGKDQEQEVESVLIAGGLVPRTEKLAGLAKGPSGEVIVDGRMRTSVAGVYAAGDVCGPPYLTPVARREGWVAAENILGRDCTMDYGCIPQSLNLASEFGFVRQEGGNALTLRVPGPAGPGTFWSVPFRDTGISKVSVDADNGRILSVGSAGPGSGIIAGYMAFLMRNGFSAEDLTPFLEVHPSTDGIQGLLKYAAGYIRKNSSG